MIIGVDFDGTIIPRVHKGFCDIDTGAEKVLKRLVNSGHFLVLWTCRNNSLQNPYNYIGDIFREETSLEEAIRWFDERNIPLYGINSVPGEVELVGKTRKILCDILIDDTALGIPITWGNVNYVSYETGEIIYNYYTYCVDWRSIEAILISKKII